MANEFVARKGFISLGGITLPATLVNSNYTIGADDYLVEITANTVQIDLPTAVGIEGKIYQIKNSGNGIVTVQADGSELIDGSSSETLGQNQSLQVISNGTGWVIAG